MDDFVTSYRRVLAAVNLSKMDRVPVVPQITYTTSRISGLKFSEPMFDPNLMADALYSGFEHFEYDGIYVGWESSFNLMAEAMGCYGEQVTEPEQIVPALRRAVESGLPAVLDVVVDREIHGFPPDLEVLDAIWMEGCERE